MQTKQILLIQSRLSAKIETIQSKSNSTVDVQVEVYWVLVVQSFNKKKTSIDISQVLRCTYICLFIE